MSTLRVVPATRWPWFGQGMLLAPVVVGDVMGGLLARPRRSALRPI
jgi:hypothetical protein